MSLMIEIRLIEIKKYNFNQFGYEKFECIRNWELIKCKPYKDYEFRFSENEFMKNKSIRCFINNGAGFSR